MMVIHWQKEGYWVGGGGGVGEIRGSPSNPAAVASQSHFEQL